MATTIKVLSTNRFNGYFEVNIEIRVDIPTALISLPNKQEIADSYRSQYGISRIEGDYVYFNKLCTFEDGTTNSVIQATFDVVASAYEQGFAAFALLPFDDMIGKTYDGTNWIYVPPVMP